MVEFRETRVVISLVFFLTAVLFDVFFIVHNPTWGLIFLAALSLMTCTALAITLTSAVDGSNVDMLYFLVPVHVLTQIVRSHPS